MKRQTKLREKGCKVIGRKIHERKDKCMFKQWPRQCAIRQELGINRRGESMESERKEKMNRKRRVKDVKWERRRG